MKFVPLYTLKTGKAAGPDDIPGDLWKLPLLSEATLRYLHTLFHLIFRHYYLPKSWSTATIVAIYKQKGDIALPASWRPISLLQTLYKLYASLLAARLTSGLADRVRSQQFGFQAGKSSVDPMHILRRLQDLHKYYPNHPFYVGFLDWEKAFDKVYPAGLLAALRRLGLAELYL